MSLRDYVRDLCDPMAPLDVPQRYRHDEPSCSSGKDACLTITRRRDGWEFYCHRCGSGGVISLTGMTVKQTRQFMAGNNQPRIVHGATRQVRLPADFTQEIPAQGLAWLFRYGITPEEIERFRIGYSGRENRVILPVYDRNNQLVYWQGRYLGDHKADKARKYLNQWNAQRDRIYFFNEHKAGGDRVVLVEDILSAIKVGRVVHAIGLLFATVPRELVRSLVDAGYQRIWLWLDADKAEYSARQLIRLRSFNYPVRRVYSPRDPKCYSEKEIREHLNIQEESNE